MVWTGSRGLEPADEYFSATSLETKRALGRLGQGDDDMMRRVLRTRPRPRQRNGISRCNLASNVQPVIHSVKGANVFGELCARERDSPRNLRSNLVKLVLSPG